VAYTYRKAVMADIPAIHKLINDYAAEGLMLRRPIMMLYEGVRDFVVALDEAGQVVGCSALHVMGTDLAEVRSLAVAPSTKGKGVGRAMVDFCVEEAKQLGLTRVFALTYQQAFFEKCGFHVVKKETLPQKVWKECVYCDRFHACDEIAMIRYLVPGAEVPTDLELPVIDLPVFAKS
jgi:amino-acid N-acetyltransferase